MEEKLGMDVNDGLAKHALENSIKRLGDEMSERGDEISVGRTDNEVREFRGIMAARLPTIEQQREGLITVEQRINSIKTEETHWRTEAERQSDLKKKRLYEAIADVAALKADEMRLRANIRPESERAQSIVEEGAENNDLTRFERFKRWARRNLGCISVLAVSVAGIIITLVMGARTAIKKGASATSKFAKALAKIGEKAAPVLGALLNLVAKVLTAGAKAIGFLSEKPLASCRCDSVRTLGKEQAKQALAKKKSLRLSYLVRKIQGKYYQ